MSVQAAGRQRRFGWLWLVVPGGAEMVMFIVELAGGEEVKKGGRGVDW